MPFGAGDAIHVLAPEDLVVFKAIFDRDKDWRVIEELAFAQGDELDAAYARGWLERIVGASDPRYRRLDEALDPTPEAPGVSIVVGRSLAFAMRHGGALPP